MATSSNSRRNSKDSKHSPSLSVGKTVEDKVSFSKLKKITNETLQSDAIKIAWKAVRDVVSLRLMGDRGCAVPYLHEATKYGLLNVLVKERKHLTDKLARKPSVIHWSAPLENILPTNIKMEEFRTMNKVELIDLDSREMMQYHLRNTDKDKDGKQAKKSANDKKTHCDVEVRLYNIQHYKVHTLYEETPVALNKHFIGLETIEKIYLITEVFVASKVIMNVQVGENRYQWNSSSMIPIGFVFRRCEMTPAGILRYGNEVERKKAIEYNWVPSDDKDTRVKKTTRNKSIDDPTLHH